jgi:hypothetical protein
MGDMDYYPSIQAVKPIAPAQPVVGLGNALAAKGADEQAASVGGLCREAPCSNKWPQPYCPRHQFRQNSDSGLDYCKILKFRSVDFLRTALIAAGHAPQDRIRLSLCVSIADQHRD